MIAEALYCLGAVKELAHDYIGTEKNISSGDFGFCFTGSHCWTLRFSSACGGVELPSRGSGIRILYLDCSRVFGE